MFLRRKMRREYGITVASVIAAARSVADRGEVDTNDQDGLTSAIAAELAGENSQLKTVQVAGQVDWDAIIEFIEKLIPLIMKIISLFA